MIVVVELDAENLARYNIADNSVSLSSTFVVKDQTETYSPLALN
jgi:hypothetical protein